MLCPTLCNPMDCSPLGSSVHEILQAIILECTSMPYSRGSFQPRDWTWVSCTTGRFFTVRDTREAPSKLKKERERKKKAHQHCCWGRGWRRYSEVELWAQVKSPWPSLACSLTSWAALGRTSTLGSPMPLPQCNGATLDSDFILNLGTEHLVTLNRYVTSSSKCLVIVPCGWAGTWHWRLLEALNVSTKSLFWDFPGGPVVKNLSANTGDMGLIPGPGTKIPHAGTKIWEGNYTHVPQPLSPP